MRKLNLGILKRITAVTLAAAMVFNYGANLVYASDGITASNGSDSEKVNVVVNPSQIVNILIQNKGSSIDYAPLNDKAETQLEGKIVVASKQIGQTDVLVAVSMDALPDGISYEEMPTLENRSSIGVISEEKKEIESLVYEKEEALIRDSVAASVRNIQVFAGNTSGDTVDVDVFLNEADQWKVVNADSTVLLSEEELLDIQTTETPTAHLPDSEDEALKDVQDEELSENTPSIEIATGSAVTSEPDMKETPDLTEVPDISETKDYDIAPVPEETPSPQLDQIKEQAEESKANVDLSFRGDSLLSVVKMNLRNNDSGSVTMDVAFSGSTQRSIDKLPIQIDTLDQNGNKLEGAEYTVFKTKELAEMAYGRHSGNFYYVSDLNKLNLQSLDPSYTYCVMQIAPSGYKTPDDFIATFTTDKKKILNLKSLDEEVVNDQSITVKQNMDLSSQDSVLLTVTNGISGEAYQYVTIDSSDMASANATINGNPVFCYNKGLKFPETGDRYIQTKYSDEVETNKDIKKKISNILYSGYPFDNAGLMRPNGELSALSVPELRRNTSFAIWRTLGEKMDSNPYVDKIISHAESLGDNFSKEEVKISIKNDKIKFFPDGENQYITDPITVTVENSLGSYSVIPPKNATAYDALFDREIKANDKMDSGSSFYLKMSNYNPEDCVTITADGYVLPSDVVFYKPVGVISRATDSKYLANQNMLGYSIKKWDVLKVFKYELGSRPVEPSTNPTAVPTPVPTASSEPTLTPVPTAIPEPTLTPVPTASSEPTLTPVPTAIPEPTLTPVPTAIPEPTLTPVPTASSEPTLTPVPTAIPEPTLSPEPSVTPDPTISPAPTTVPDIDLPEPSTPAGGSGFYPPPYPANPSAPDAASTPSAAPTPSNEPSGDIDIPDDDVPLADGSEESNETAIDIPDLPTPLSGAPEVSIPDEDVPLSASNPIEIEDEKVPLASDDPGIDIPDEDVPLGLLPQTGGSPLSLLSIIGIGIVLTGLWMKKRKAEE